MPLDPVEVAVGSDGKPGAPPPEKDAVVYNLVKKHVGKGVLLNSDGGSGGDGDHDRGLSMSPYAKAARRMSQCQHDVLHGGVDHTAHQYSRFMSIIVGNKNGFQRVARSQTTGARRIRAEVSTNHIEVLWKYLKRQLPANLPYKAYVEDPWSWLMCAAWRLRVMRDPFLAFGRLLQGREEDDEQTFATDEEESDDDGESSSGDEED